MVKPIGHFRNKKKIKVHRFTNNLQGLHKVMVKDFSWNIISWNALLFKKTLKQLSILVVENCGFILNTCHDTANRAETRVGFPRYFLQTPMTDWALVSPGLLFFISVVIHEVWAFGQYCLPKVSNVFKGIGHLTFGNRQRPVFSLGVNPNMHKITHQWKCELNWSSKLQENNERKNALVAQICLLSDAYQTIERL